MPGAQARTPEARGCARRARRTRSRWPTRSTRRRGSPPAWRSARPSGLRGRL